MTETPLQNGERTARNAVHSSILFLAALKRDQPKARTYILDASYHIQRPMNRRRKNYEDTVKHTEPTQSRRWIVPLISGSGLDMGLG